MEELLAAGTRRVLARVSDPRSVTVDVLLPKIKLVVDKYLLKDDRDASLEAINSFIDTLQADDLCLIVACEQGNQSAWSELINRFSGIVRSAARSASSNEEAAEDLSQSIWAELHGLRVREDGKPAGKLGYYSGRGSLAGWLRAVVAQLAVDHHRKESRLVQPEEDSDLDRLARDGKEGGLSFATEGTVDPEQAVSNKLAATEMEKALMRSMKELSNEDRLLVKLYYFDGLRLREAGAVLGVHEATASRRLTRIHSELRSKVENILVGEQGWTKAETQRSFAEAAIRLEADIEPMLAEASLGDKAMRIQE
jgi:RNA polymerase sigma-70 factor